MEYLQLLHYANFTKLWLAQILSQVGQNLLNFALIILVYDVAAGSRFANLSVALLVLAFGLPSLLFAPMAGRLVDHWDRKHILVISNLLRAGLVLLYITIDEHLWLILLLSFVVSTILQFFIPAETATIPKIVPSKLLLPANSLFVFTIYVSFIVGYSASGPVVQTLGEYGPYIAVASMLALATILVAFLPRQPVDRPPAPHGLSARALRLPPKPDPHALMRLQLWRDMSENWKLITAHQERFFSILQLAVTQAVVSILVTLAPALSRALLHIPLQDASHIIIIPVGVGMVLGVLLVNVVTRSAAKATVIQVGLIIAGVTLTLLGLSADLYHFYSSHSFVPVVSIALIVGMLMLILGLINAMISAAAQTLLQESTSDNNRGKIFASLNMMINIAATAPILLTGLLADLISVTRVVALIGIILTIYAVAMLRYYRPLRRNHSHSAA